MRPELEKRIARLAQDRESGASEILDEVIALLRDAIAAREEVTAVCSAVCDAQPSMAPVWNAAQAARAWESDPERFERFARRVARAPDALARFGEGVLALGQPDGAPLRIVTFSYSRSVLGILERIARRRPVHAACSEGRPALEGRRMAERLVAAGVEVTFFTDAAIAQALDASAQVLVGADAVTPDWFLNKSGTRMLAAVAVQQGVPVYVAASRDKVVDQRTGDHLTVRCGAPAEVWDAAPAPVAVVNPYFERVPLELLAGVISDVGVVLPAEVRHLSDYEY